MIVACVVQRGSVRWDNSRSAEKEKEKKKWPQSLGMTQLKHPTGRVILLFYRNELYIGVR